MNPNPAWKPAPYEAFTLTPVPTVSRKGRVVIDKRWHSGMAPCQVRGRSIRAAIVRANDMTYLYWVLFRRMGGVKIGYSEQDEPIRVDSWV